MGDAISSHDGVRSCPALHLETDKKYIIKIISVPASQSKLDALLLAGAFSDRESAEEYFRELADDVIHEAEVLQNLAKHEGYIAFEDLQLVPMQEGETGFDVYLLGEYRNTLDGVLRTNEMTHLQAINLGLDLCAALSAARRLGYLYSNLKPSNIFLYNEREFRIADLGFLSLDSLQFASLPDKYRSEYTPAEISDAYAALNNTMDTYAVGLILYQAYNNGKLPVIGGTLEAPVHADPALAEIILKACAADPADRWEDPIQMGQALANYMQSNPVNDVSIVPVTEEAAEPQEIFPDEDAEPSTDDILSEVDQALETAPPLIVSPVAEEAPAEAEEIADEPVAETVPESTNEPVEESTEELVEEAAEESVEETAEESADEAVAEEAEVSENEPAVASTDAEVDVVEDAPLDEQDATEESEDAPVEDETAQMLAQADDLIAYQLPDPPVAPEPFEVTLPPKEEPAEESVEEVPSEDAEAESAEECACETEADEVPESEESKEDSIDMLEDEPKPKDKRKSLIITAIVLAAVLVFTIAAALFYQYSYIQTIADISLVAQDDQLTVHLTTDIPDEKLTVKCTDIHGNALTASVENGTAYFSGLRFGTAYTLEVRINGFHKLIGRTTADFTTVAQTVINGFYAVTGPEDGSVVLSFTPQGPNSDDWKVTYVASGEKEHSVTFTGPVVTLTGLTVGKEYTFTLSPANNLNTSGMNTITYTATNVLYAQNLRISGFENGNLTIAWDAPEGVTIPKWYVRCYNDAGFDKTMTVEDTSAIIDGIDLSSDYMIEVTADGMSLNTRIELTAGAILINNIAVSASNSNGLNVTWDFEGNAPADGWVLQYSIDGNSVKTVTCDSNSAVIKTFIPGSSYDITIKPANDTTYFGGNIVYKTKKAPAFSNYLVTASDMEFSMCKTPDKNYWDRNDVPSKDYTTSFKVGVSASLLMHVTKKTTKTDDIVTTMYVIRDADGKLISFKSESRTWDDMWDSRYGTLTIPKMPENPGKYTVEIYFDGAAVTTQSFEILAKN